MTYRQGAGSIGLDWLLPGSPARSFSAPLPSASRDERSGHPLPGKVSVTFSQSRGWDGLVADTWNLAFGLPGDLTINAIYPPLACANREHPGGARPSR